MSENEKTGQYRSQYRCPSCDRPIFNRRYPNCEGCEHELPEHLLYTDQQRNSYDKEIQQRLERPPGSVAGSPLQILGMPDANSWFGDGDE